MDIILVPGLWLDASSWGQVTPHLERAGHRVHPITLPGMESEDSDRSRVTRADCVDAIVSVIDAAEEPVVVVGHSMGAGLAYAALDARPDRVARAIYVGGFPTPDGSTFDEFPTENGGIPLLDWSAFDEADLRDLDEADLDALRARAIPSPAGLARDPQRLTDPRRYQVPVTMICSEFDTATLRSWIEADLEPVREYARIHDITYVDLPTGHWPQFSKPTELGRAILDAIDG